jgi:outer membrane protein TolC
MLFRRLLTASALAFIVTISCGQGAQAPAPLPSVLPLFVPLDAPPGVPAVLHDLLVKALKSNLEIQARRLDPAIQQDRVRAAWGAFDPTLSFGALYEEAERALNQRDFLGSGQVSRVYEEANERLQTGFAGRIPTGLVYELQLDHARLDNTYNRAAVSLFHPEYQSTAIFRVTQPLLRDFGFAANLAEVRLARNAKQVSENEFRASVDRVIAQTMAAYFEAVFAQENIRVKQQAIGLAENLLRENRRRVDEGRMAPIDVIQAQARIAEAQEELILAQSLLSQRRNTLKELTSETFEFDSPELAFPAENIRLPIPNVQRELVLGTVFERNPTYLAAVESAKAEDLRVAYARNQRRPRVDLKASYGTNGLGRDFENSFHDFAERSQPDWSAGISVSIPWNTTAHHRWLEAKKRQLQAALNIKRVEVSLQSAVDTAIRDIDSARRRVEIVKDTTRLAEAALDAEQRRLVNGLTTSYNVLAVQKELSQARSRELATAVDLNKAITTLLLVEGTLAEAVNIRVTN